MDLCMEHPTDVQSLVERGDALLNEDKAAEAAAEYTRAVQADPSAIGAHLGLAKAYLALGSYGYVYMACQQVQRLAPNGADAAVAQGILLVLDHRYDAAIRELDRAETLRPGQPYVHALRAYCYRRMGNSYDAMSAEAKAARLSGIREWSHLFPKEPVLQPVPNTANNVVALPGPSQPSAPNGEPTAAGPQSPRPWDQRSQMQRRVVRARFVTRNVPVVTYTLIGINLAVYLLAVLTGGTLLNPTNSPIYDFGIQQGALLQQDPLQAYRLITAMFLHAGIAHIGFNMLSLYFVGIWVEQIFGKWRYLAIYLIGGLAGGLAQALLAPTVASLGASGAIFAIFAAFGAFFVLRRRTLGPAGNAMIGQWVFWLALNLYLSFSDPNIALYDHLGGLIVGFVLGMLFTNMAMTQRKR